jgi:low temperature requirement protein LtrA
LLCTSGVFLLGALLSAAGFLTSESQIIAFFIAGVVVMLCGSVINIWRRVVEDSSVMPHALNERFGMLLLIVLGVSFIVLVDTLGATGGIPQPLYFVLTICVVFSIWLMYFPQISQFARPETIRSSAARFSAHFVLVVCSANAVAAFASQATLTPSSGEFGWGSDHWTSLPLVVLLLAIVWLGFLESSRWSAIQTIHSVSAGMILILAVLGTLDNYDFGALTLAFSAVIFLLDAIVTDTISRSRISLSVNN